MIFLFMVVCALASTTTLKGEEKGTEPLPFDKMLKQEIRDTFYEDNGRYISLAKISAYEQAIHERYSQVRENMIRYYIGVEGMSKKKAKKKADEESDLVSYVILMEKISKLKRLKDPVSFDRVALRVLEMDEALKVEGKKLAGMMLFEKMFASLKSWKIPVKKTPGGEASNLVDPGTGMFFSQAQLSRMKKRGADISKLNPPVDSTFWQVRDIESTDVKKHYETGQDALHEGLEIIFPEENHAFYKKIRFTQTKPKIDIYIRHPRTGEKLDYKLKIGSEIHSDITASSLYAALGFSVDISRYVRDFKLILGKVAPHEFKRHWNSYYSRYDIERYIKEEGQDVDGHYIIFHEGVLEYKPDELLRVGPWAYGSHGHRGLREVRGTLIFNMWVSNLDLKEAENNKLIIREVEGEDKYRFFHIQQDMGFAFGLTYIERPGDFKWNLVVKRSPSYIHLSYHCFQKNSGFKHVTYADAKWMSRLIARLTREQIENAVRLGGWPESMGQLLIEKLIARRNQLVLAFDLEGEVLPNGQTIRRLPFNRYLTTADGVVVNGKLVIYELPGYSQYFGPRIRELVPIIFRGLKDAAVDGLVNGISAIHYIQLVPGGKAWPDMIGRVMVEMNREIEPNPLPSGREDDYLVKDSIELGLRLGYGASFSGEVMYVRRYDVVYPVRSREQGRYHRGFIIDFLLPGHTRGAFHTSQRFVAVIEDYIEIRGRAIVGANHHSALGASAEAAKVRLQRHFISRKQKDRLIFFQDNSGFKELSGKIFLEFTGLFRFRVPIFTAYTRKGKTIRQQVEVDLTDLAKNKAKQEAIEKLFQVNDATKLFGQGTVKTIDDRFREKKIAFSLLGLVKDRSIFRVDHIREKGKPGVRLQVDSQKQKSWRFFDNGEKHFSWVRLTGKANGAGEMIDPVLTISLRINDLNTTDGELKNSYQGFMSKVAQDSRFMSFDSGAHSWNKRWGNVLVYFDMTLYEEGLQKLLQATSEDTWQSLGEVLGQSPGRLKYISQPVRHGGRLVYMGEPEESRLARKTAYFIGELERAKKAKKSILKMSHLVQMIRKAVFLTGHGFDPTLLAVLHRLVGSKNLYLEAWITMPINRENVFPERIPLYDQLGERRRLEPEWFDYILEEPAEIYHFFKENGMVDVKKLNR